MKAYVLQVILAKVFLTVFLCPLFAQVHGVKDEQAMERFQLFLESDGEVVWALRNRTLEKIHESMYVEKIYHPEKAVMTHFIQYESINRDIKSGPYVEWYDNANPRMEGEYKNDQKNGIWYYYTYGRDYLSSFGEYVNDKREGIWQELDSLGRIRMESMYSHGELHGQQVTYHRDGRQAILRTYENGKLKSTSISDTAGLERSWLRMKYAPYMEGCEKPQVFEAMDSCSTKKWLEMLYKKVRYPASAREYGVEGEALFLIRFSNAGVIEQIETLRGVTDDIEKTCREALAKSSKFRPATQTGRPIEYMMELPMRFRLD